MGLKRAPRPNPIGVGVRCNVGSTSRDGRLRNRAISQYNDHLAAAHTSRHSFGLGKQLKFAVLTLSLHQSYVTVNDTENFQLISVFIGIFDRFISITLELGSSINLEMAFP